MMMLKLKFAGVAAISLLSLSFEAAPATAGGFWENGCCGAVIVQPVPVYPSCSCGAANYAMIYTGGYGPGYTGGYGPGYTGGYGPGYTDGYGPGYTGGYGPGYTGGYRGGIYRRTAYRGYRGGLNRRGYGGYRGGLNRRGY